MNIETNPSIASTPNSNVESENSAVFLLLKKMASGTSRVLGGMMDLPWDGDEMVTSFDDAGIMRELLDVDTNEEYGMAAGMLSDVFLPYLSPMLKMLLPPGDDCPEQIACSIKSPDRSIPSSNSSETTTTSYKEQSSPAQSGLVLPTHDVMEKLDYVITQMDISRMERTASRRLDVDNIHHLPTITYGEGNDIICPPEDDHDDEMDDDLVNDQDKFDQENTWSWMVVPRDTSQELSRIAERNWRGVPESISICSSTRTMSSRENKQDLDTAYDYCVICREHFQEGEVLRVLPCEHLFHSSCACSNKILEETLYGCPMCQKKETPGRLPITPSVKNTNKKDKSPDLQVDSSSHSDGSVPSWAFVKLGNLLSSKGTKDNVLNSEK